MENNLPFVSIVIPCRNEEKFIGKCLDSIIANNYPKDNLEILVIDGMSEDGTKKVVEGYSRQYPFIKYLENPKKITPCALNIGIKEAKGGIVMRMDAHATYKEDYVSKCIRYLNEYNADNVGGVMMTLPMENTFTGKAIVIALSSRFGVGNSAFRTGSKEPKWVDTVFGGCYKKEVFEKIGLFNENLVSTQDMEFNLRLKRAGGKILLHPDIISYYYTRSNLKDFCKNNFRNGFWAIYPIKFTKEMPVSLRHLVPLVFVFSLVFSLVTGMFAPTLIWLFFSIMGAYVALCIYSSLVIALREGNFFYLLMMPVVFTILHFLYGLGSLWALFGLLSLKKKIVSSESK